MKPRQVFGLIVLETIFVAFFAVVLGGGAGLGWDWYLSQKGLDLTSLTGGFSMHGTFINPVWKAVISLRGVFVPMLTVSLVCFFVSLYPAFRAGRIKPVDALKDRG